MAANYGAPGVYIEEVRKGAMPIEGVGTAVAAFIGFTSTYRPELGDPADPDGVRPQLVTSWAQYERLFGGYAPDVMLPHSVNGYFLNGGTKAYIVRVPRGGQDTAVPVVSVPTQGRPSVESLRLEGILADSMIEVVVDEPPPAGEDQEPPHEFTLRVLSEGAVVEEHPHLTLGRGAQNVERIASEHVRVKAQQQQGMSVAERLPQAGSYVLERPTATLAQVTATDFEGSMTERRGYLGLDVADDVTMVMLPDLVTVATNADGTLDMDTYIAAQGKLVDWCEASKTRMAILDAPPSLDATRARDWLARLARTSPFATAYYPQLVVDNPLARAGATNGERFLTIPPSGHVAGVWANVDANRGVWKAPANEPVRGVIRLDNDVTTGEQDLLNPQGINCIRTLRDQGIRIWGARTLATVAQPDWRYIPIRRTFTFIESSIQRAIAWAVFEPHDQDLRERVKRTIRSFLLGIWRQGGLVGATPDEAFYVVCDQRNNPRSSVAEGRLVVDVGVCPVRPAEFVVFRITQWEGGSETTD